MKMKMCNLSIKISDEAKNLGVVLDRYRAAVFINDLFLEIPSTGVFKKLLFDILIIFIPFLSDPCK